LQWNGWEGIVKGFFKTTKKKRKKITINSHPIYRFYHKSTSVYVLGSGIVLSKKKKYSMLLSF